MVFNWMYGHQRLHHDVFSLLEPPAISANELSDGGRRNSAQPVNLRMGIQFLTISIGTITGRLLYRN